jgi:hypothetical protein
MPLIRSRTSIAAICLIGAAAILLQDLVLPAGAIVEACPGRRVISAKNR